MDRRTWQAIVHRVARVGHNLVAKHHHRFEQLMNFTIVLLTFYLLEFLIMWLTTKKNLDFLAFGHNICRK